MKSLSIVLILSLIVLTLSGRGWPSKNKNKGKSKGKSKGTGSSKKNNGNFLKGSKKSSKKATPAPVTPSPTDYIPTNDELCDCYDIDLVCAPISNNDNEICYYYLVTKTSDDDYCEPISSLKLGTNNDDCGVDVDDLLLDYAPKCYDINVCQNGIRVTLDSPKSSGSYGGSKKSGNEKSGTKTDNDGSTGSDADSQDDYIIFSMCFDSSQVSGFQANGQIDYETQDGDSYTCDIDNVLPNFCSTTTTSSTTADPTSASPTTATPTTASPTTADPTSASPTTIDPTAAPTTVAPTTASPTTSAPTTPAPTTPSPIECGDPALNGQYNGQSLTFEVNIPYNGDMTFDISGSAIASDVIGFSAIYTDSLGNSQTVAALPGITSINLPDLPPGIVEFTINAGSVTGGFSVISICSSDSPTASPIPKPTTPAPTTPSPIECGDPAATGQYNGQSLTFEVNIPYNGDMVFDISGSAIASDVIAFSAAYTDSLGNSQTVAALPGITSINLPDLPPGIVEFSINAGSVTGGYSVISICSSDSPTAAPTTSQPSMAPTYVECEGNDAYNIAFLLDESGSVDQSEWTTIKTFVERIITYDVTSVSYVALYEYASLPGFDNFYEFDGPKSGEEANMIQALDDNGWTLAGKTETWDAVNRVLDDFWTYNQIIPNYFRKNVLFLVTDGNPTDEAGDPNKPASFISLDYNTCPYIENRLRTQFPANYVDIVILVIDPDSSIDTSKIECLDYFDNGADIIEIESFNSASFTDIESRIREKICTRNQIPPEGVPPGTPEWVYPNNSTGLGPVPTAPGGGRDCSNDPGANNPCDTTTPAP